MMPMLGTSSWGSSTCTDVRVFRMVPVSNGSGYEGLSTMISNWLVPSRRCCFFDDLERDAIVEQPGAGANNRRLTDCVGEADARCDVVGGADVGLPVVADAGHQRRPRRQPDVALHEERDLELAGFEQRVAAGHPVIDWPPQLVGREVRERERASEILLGKIVVGLVEAVDARLQREQFAQPCIQGAELDIAPRRRREVLRAAAAERVEDVDLHLVTQRNGLGSIDTKVERGLEERGRRQRRELLQLHAPAPSVGRGGTVRQREPADILVSFRFRLETDVVGERMGVIELIRAGRY